MIDADNGRHACCNVQRMLRDTCPELAADDELWRVRLPSGERTMTLDELDAAFDAGHIDGSTLVCAPGACSFDRLGAVAGLDEPSLPSVPTPMTSVSPMVLSDRSTPRMPLASLDLGDAPFQKRFSKKLLAIPAGLAVLATVIGIAASASASSETIAAAGESARTEIVAPAPPAAITEPAVIAAPATTEAPASALTDAQKKLLSAKDKKAEAARNTKHSLVTAPKHFATSKSKGSAPFSKGGNPHDPLNGAI